MPGSDSDEPTKADNPADKLPGGCIQCFGAGWLVDRGRLVGNNPYALIPCPLCKDPALRAEAEAALLAESNLESYAFKRFDNFERVAGAEMALSMAKSYAHDIKQNPKRGWLLLFGGYGTGKTHLAASIAFESGLKAYFAVVPDMLDELRRGYEDGSYAQKVDFLKSVPLLILDDLGTENISEWVKERLFVLLNHRYEARSPTVITTNSLSKCEARVISRLGDARVCQRVKIEAPSFREHKDIWE